MSDGRKANRRRKGRRPGFTIIELLFVVLIGGVLATIAVPQFNKYLSHRNAVNARTAVMMAASRARAAAIERGEVVTLMVRIYRDSVFVMGGDKVGTDSWEDTLEVVGFRDGDIRGDILLNGTPAPFIICYLPRGFAHPSCEDGKYLPVEDIGFVSHTGTDTVWARINAVGRIESK